MRDRLERALDFARAAGWGDAQPGRIAGDASTRRYYRLKRGSRTAIVMDCPEDAGDIAPFLSVAAHLRRRGLSAPEIFAADRAAGFVLMEDLGDASYARVLRATAGAEEALYGAAVDALLRLHDCAPPAGLPVYDPSAMAQAVAPAFEWYCPDGPSEAFHAVAAGLEAILAEVSPRADVMVLRDFHAENLIWLPDRRGPARAGLLDFQDALIGHRSYDLTSLLQDARRDVSAQCVRSMIARYLRAAGLPRETFLAACAVQGAQRNLRILGVFARLARAAGKPYYVDLLPRVWLHLTDNLEHPALSPVRGPILSALPAPDPGHLNRLRSA